MNNLYYCIAITLLCSIIKLNVAAAEINNYRLPKSIHPEHYKVQILTHLGDENGFKFYGKVWIKVNIQNLYMWFCVNKFVDFLNVKFFDFGTSVDTLNKNEW